MEKIQGVILFIFTIFIISAPVCFAETPEHLPDTLFQSPATPLEPSSNSLTSETSKNSKNNFHLEVGGSYSDVNNNDQWKSLDIRLRYSGLEKITPFGSVSTLNRKNGSQRVYGLGSYINVSAKFYMIAGISGAPVKDPKVILYPKLRMDLSGYFSAPIVDGLVISTGITHIPKQNGNGTDILSLGGIYYGKIILMGSLNYNIAQPGGVTSMSGQVGFMYGAQGKYWISGGATMGRAAYQLASSSIPTDVRYKSRGVNLSYSQWFGKNWGINTRLDYGEIVVGEAKLIGLTTSLFLDF
jgi:YaiO family outer membrane protein